jgi:hypothetical protein
MRFNLSTQKRQNLLCLKQITKKKIIPNKLKTGTAETTMYLQKESLSIFSPG